MQGAMKCRGPARQDMQEASSMHLSTVVWVKNLSTVWVNNCIPECLYNCQYNPKYEPV